MKLITLQGFRGLVTTLGLDCPAPNTPACLNVSVGDATIKPRYGYRNLGSAHANCNGVYGFSHLVGYGSNKTQAEEWVLVQSISGIVKPFSVNPSTYAQTEITNGGAALSLSAETWAAVSFGDASYWFNPLSATSVYKHTIGDVTSWSALNALPNATPTGEMGVSFTVPTDTTPPYNNLASFGASDTVASNQGGRVSSTTPTFTSTNRYVTITTNDTGGGYGNGWVEFEVTFASNWVLSSNMAIGFLINNIKAGQLESDASLGTSNDGFLSDLTNWILTLTNAVPTSATVSGGTRTSVTGKLDQAGGSYAYVWFDLSGVASAVLSNVHKLKLRIPLYLTGTSIVRVDGVWLGGIRYHNQSNYNVSTGQSAGTNYFINDTGGNTSTIEYAFNYTEAAKPDSTAATATPIPATDHLGERFVSGQNMPYSGSQIALNVPLTTASPYTTSATINLYRKVQLPITGATNASPIVLTIPSHGLVDGTQHTISNVKGNTAANGSWYVKSTGANTVALYQDSGLTTPVIGNGSYTSGTGNLNGRWQRISTGANSANLIFYDTLTDSTISSDTATYPIASSLNFTAPSYVSSGVVNACAYKGWVVWLYPGGESNVRHSQVGDPEVTLDPEVGSSFSPSDETRPATFTLADNYGDEPIGAVQAGQVLLIAGHQGIYSQWGDTPSSMTPTRKTPGSLGCAGRFAYARFRSDHGDPGIAYVDPSGEGCWFVGSSSVFSGDAQARPVELTSAIRGQIREFLYEPQKDTFSWTDISELRIDVDEHTNSLWLVLGARALVLRPPSPIDGARHWERYEYNLDVGGSGSGSTTTTQTATISVPLPGSGGFPYSSYWVDSGVTVVAGDSVVVTASGHGTFTPTPGANVAYPEGWYGDTSTSHNPGDPGLVTATGAGFNVTNCYKYSLVAGIGSAAPGFGYASGIQGSRSFSFTATSDGKLFFCFNDDLYSDNVGSFSVSVTATHTVDTGGANARTLFTSFSPGRKLWWVLGTGQIQEIEWNSASLAYITGANRDGGQPMPSGYYTTPRIRKERRRVMHVGLERDGSAGTPVITVFTEVNPSGESQTVAAGERFARFSAQATGWWNYVKVSVDEADAAISAIQVSEYPMSQTRLR